MLQFLAATRKTNTSFPKTCIIGTCLGMEGGKKKEISPISIATTMKSFWVLFFWKEWAMRRANVLRACLKDFIVGIESILVSNNPGTLVPTLWCDTWESSRFHLMDDFDLWEALKTIVWTLTAFCGVTLVDTLIARDRDEEMLPLLERAPSLTKNHRFPCVALLAVLELWIRGKRTEFSYYYAIILRFC